MGEVFEGAVFLQLLQAAIDATFPAQHWQFAGQALLGDVGEAGSALAADFPAFDQALVVGFPQFVSVQAGSKGEVDAAVDALGHSFSLNSGFVGQLRCAR
ncbi:hypothetical protein D3C76_1618250 [compost metagenome]